MARRWPNEARRRSDAGNEFSHSEIPRSLATNVREIGRATVSKPYAARWYYGVHAADNVGCYNPRDEAWECHVRVAYNVYVPKEYRFAAGSLQK